MDWDKVEKCKHKNVHENYLASLGCACGGCEYHCKDCGVFFSVCDCGEASGVSGYEFFRQLEYKSEWNGKNLVKIGRFEPSSKMCGCGDINKELKLSDRRWTCKKCGVENDRDLLAARNIKKFGLMKLNYNTRIQMNEAYVALLARIL